jgi:hypothetical protein
MRQYITATTLLSTLLVGYPAIAQESTGVLRWSVQVADADAILSRSKAFRFYDPPERITLELLLSNESSKPFVITQAGLSDDITFELFGETAIPIISRWSDEPLHDDGRMPVLPATAVHVQPDSGVLWTVQLSRADGERFAAGSYSVRVAVNLRNTQTPEGERWPGRLLATEDAVVVVCQPPSSAASEQAAAHRQLARKAATERRFDDAVNAYQRAVAADPADRASLIYLADLLLQLGRFKEAIPPLERALAMGHVDRNMVPSLLAFAYVGVGDDNSARRVLSNAGVNSERVRDQILKYRSEALKRRRP